MASANNTTEVTTTKVVLTSVFITIVMVATVIGNSLVIFCVFHNPRLRGRTNYLIVSLAVADWLIGMVSDPLKLVQTLNYEKWPTNLNTTGCQFWIWVDMLCCAVSILSLMAISIDRLVAITDPLKYENRMRPLLVYPMIAVTWVFGVVCASLSLVKWKGAVVIDVSTDKPQCSISSKEYITFVSTAAFFVPLVVVLVNYGLIFRVAIRHAKRLAKDNQSLALAYQPEDSVDTNHNDDGRVNPFASPSMEKKRSFVKLPKFVSGRTNAKKANRTAKLCLVKQLKATKTLAVVVGVFCVCWLPFFIIFVTFQYCPKCFKEPYLSKSEVTVLTSVFVTILPVANSAANPIIYTCFNTEFRRAFKKILWKMLKIKTPTDNDNTTFTAVPSGFTRDARGSRDAIEAV